VVREFFEKINVSPCRLRVASQLRVCDRPGQRVRCSVHQVRGMLRWCASVAGLMGIRASARRRSDGVWQRRRVDNYTRRRTWRRWRSGPSPIDRRQIVGDRHDDRIVYPSQHAWVISCQQACSTVSSRPLSRTTRASPRSPSASIRRWMTSSSGSLRIRSQSA